MEVEERGERGCRVPSVASKQSVVRYQRRAGRQTWQSRNGLGTSAGVSVICGTGIGIVKWTCRSVEHSWR